MSNKENNGISNDMKAIKFNAAKDKELVKKAIIDSLHKHGKGELKKTLFDVGLNALNLNPKKIKDKSPESAYAVAKSLIGQVLRELLDLKIVFQEDNLVMLSEVKEADKKEITNYLLDLYLTEEEKKENNPESKKVLIKGIVGSVVKKNATEIKHFENKQDIFDFVRKNVEKTDSFKDRIKPSLSPEFPQTPLGNALRSQHETYVRLLSKKINENTYNKKLKESLMEAISLAGGGFFEVTSLKLLEAQYGEYVTEGVLRGGPNDKGIDCELKTKDPMGVTEKIIVQCKTRSNKLIYEKEFREFVGIMKLFEADKGIYMTNSKYHTEVLRLLRQTKRISLIDSDNLFELMKKHKIGLSCDKHGYYRIDTKYFLIAD